MEVELANRISENPNMEETLLSAKIISVWTEVSTGVLTGVLTGGVETISVGVGAKLQANPGVSYLIGTKEMWSVRNSIRLEKIFIKW